MNKVGRDFGVEGDFFKIFHDEEKFDRQEENRVEDSNSTLSDDSVRLHEDASSPPLDSLVFSWGSGSSSPTSSPDELSGESPGSSDDVYGFPLGSPLRVKRFPLDSEDENQQSRIKVARSADRSLQEGFKLPTETRSSATGFAPTTSDRLQSIQSKSLTSLPMPSSFRLPTPDSLPLLGMSASLPILSLPKPEISEKIVVGRRQPPPTPCRRPTRSRISGYVPPELLAYNKYLAIIRGLENGRFTYKGVDYKVEAIPGAQGKYKKAFVICPGQPALIPGYDNEQILIKAYHEDCVTRDCAKIDQMTLQSIKQLSECQEHGIPVANILNIDSQTRGLIGDVFIVPKVRYAVDVQQWNIQSDGTDPLKAKMLVDFPELFSVKAIFNIAIAKLLNLDLQPDNLRYDNQEKKALVVSDFREVVDEDDFDVVDTKTNLFKNLKAWANNRLAVWNFLTSDFTKLNSDEDIARRVKKGCKEHEQLENFISTDGSSSPASSHS